MMWNRRRPFVWMTIEPMAAFLTAYNKPLTKEHLFHRLGIND
jgi:hypothetical protein